jgi:hypothetical protein
MVSTVAGMQIDCNDEQLLNASRSIRFNLESDSKVIEESDVQLEKQPKLMSSTVRGIQIDFNDEQPWNARR